MICLVVPVAAKAQFPTEPPAPDKLRPLEFPEFKEATLSNGLQLIVVENHELPVVSISLRMRAGSAYDPAGREGLAGMVAELLTKGTERRTAEQISEEIEGVGGNLSASAGSDFLTIGATVLKDNVDLAFDLISDVLLHATFPEKELELARKRTLSSLQLEQTDPNALANKYLMKALYGSHPYGKRASVASTNALQREDVVRFRDQLLKPEGALLVIAGDLKLGDGKKLAERYLASWSGSPVEADMPAPPAPRPASILLVHRPGSEQANILAGVLTMKPGDDAYYPAVLATQILGGGPLGRLFKVLREEHGWTYGSYARLQRRRDLGAFVTSAEVRNAVTDSALVELLHQIRRLGSEPADPAELEAAKGFLVGSFPLQIETPQQIARQVSTAILLGLGTDYLKTYREHLAAVSAADVQNTAAHLIKPDSLAVVVVGDGSVIYDKLSGILPVKIIDTDGNPLTPADLSDEVETIAYDLEQIVPRRDSFQIVFQGNVMGGTASELTRTGDAFQVTESTNVPLAGLEQSTTMGFKTDYSLISIEQKMTMGGRQFGVHAQMAGGRVTGKGSSPQTGDHDIDLEWEAGMVENNMLRYVIPTMPLEDGATFKLKVLDTGEGKVRTATIKVSDAGSVTVPAGTFEAYRVEIQGLQAAAVMTVSKESPRMVLKIEPIGQPLVIERVK